MSTILALLKDTVTRKRIIGFIVTGIFTALSTKYALATEYQDKITEALLALTIVITALWDSLKNIQKK